MSRGLELEREAQSFEPFELKAKTFDTRPPLCRSLVSKRPPIPSSDILRQYRMRVEVVGSAICGDSTMQLFYLLEMLTL